MNLSRMLRTILRIQIPFHLKRGCFVSKTIQESFKSNEQSGVKSLNSVLINQRNHSTQSFMPNPPSEHSESSDLLLENIAEYKDIDKLLVLIGSHLKHSTPDQLEIFYDRISIVYSLIKTMDKNKFSRRGRDMFIQTIQNSSEFVALLDRTTQLTNELSVQCLVKAFLVFKLVKLSKSETMNSVCNRLNSKIDGLSIDDLAKLATYTQFDQSDELNESILSKMKNMVLRGQVNETGSIIQCLNIFLKMPQINSKVINRMFKKLQIAQLDFKSAIKLLRVIQDADAQPSIDTSDQVNDRPIIELVDKCNATICEHLTESPDDVSFYCNKLLEYNLKPELDNFFEPKILELISPALIDTIETRLASKYNLFKLAYTYSKFNIYNEETIKCLYESLEKDEIFRFKITSNVESIFEFFAQYRFPFIDYQHLADLLFTTNDRIKDFKRLSRLLLSFSSLILNDALTNEKMFDQFNRLIIKKLKSNLVRDLSSNVVNQLILARLHLIMHSAMDGDLKSEIEFETEDWLSAMSSHLVRPPIRDRYFKINNKLQIDAYLSNGLYIGTMAIFDKNTQDLVPLIEYRKFFECVDQIPLGEHQQIIRFAQIPTLKGNVRNQLIRTNDDRMEKVLKEFNIKQIYVRREDLKNFDDLKKGLEILCQVARKNFNL